MDIPYTIFGRGDVPLYFLHANGYPPACYQPLLSGLEEDHSILAMHQRPLWPGSRPRELKDWKPLTDDFIRFLDERHAGASIVMGHSIGGIVALRAALRVPERFKVLILIDPVLFPPPIIRFWRLICSLGLGEYLHPLVRLTRKRRDRFDDLERLFNGYRKKTVFKYMDDPALRTLVKGITCPDGTGFKLCYGRDWEAHMYATSVAPDMDLWKGLPHLQVPLLILRGEHTDTFWASTGRRVIQNIPLARVISIPNATHLVPFERPMEVALAVQNFVREVP